MQSTNLITNEMLTNLALHHVQKAKVSKDRELWIRDACKLLESLGSIVRAQELYIDSIEGDK